MNVSRLERPWVQMRKMSSMYLSRIFGLVAADANNLSSSSPMNKFLPVIECLKVVTRRNRELRGLVPQRGNLYLLPGASAGFGRIWLGRRGRSGAAREQLAGGGESADCGSVVTFTCLDHQQRGNRCTIGERWKDPAVTTEIINSI
ncbi:hypothetical protein PoB_005458800 [Plakobranchus ocellatus]|uniref:Uncharacterized protein n=1 Tax=Plakobranchus ocellatus TaxID=259542 RepID=A0AAV4C990_9GAST|nr:hypothetical protein PoB_005458800 [Plakobranchus ocellatus]